MEYAVCPSFWAMRAVVDALFKRGEVVLRVGVLDIRQQLSMLAGQVQPAAKKVPG
jgi:hypothetical protein